MIITVRFTSNTYLAKAKGHKASASCTAGPRQAAEALARKLGLDPSQLQPVRGEPHQFALPADPARSTWERVDQEHAGGPAPMCM